MENNEQKILELKKEIENVKRNKNRIIVILIIIILLNLCLLAYKVGKIGYKETYSNGENLVSIYDEDINFGKDTKLNIFNNKKFENKKIIAPHSNGEYKFCIKNKANKNIKYSIKFSDEMKSLVNMKYRLKIDNIYMRGNENEYVSINNLETKDVSVMNNSLNTYTLEWYWEDNDELDTIVGTNEDGYYKLNLEIHAEEL